VRAVARAHGGEVLVRSRPGRGSEFELLLPAVHGSPALPQAGSALAPASASISVSVPAPAPVSVSVSADADGGKLARKS
jgi:hypothetical protein